MAADKLTIPCEDETWRAIPGFGGAYEASDRGRFRSLDRLKYRKNGSPLRSRGKNLKTRPFGIGGYLRISLQTPDGIKVTHLAHRLVMLAFVGPCPAGMEVRHMDGDPTNNQLSNLRYGTSKDNANDKKVHGRNANMNKDKCPIGHFLREPNLCNAQSQKGHRECLACHRAHGKVSGEDRNSTRFKEIADSYYEKIMNCP